MPEIKTKPWDMASYLRDDQDAASLVALLLQEGDDADFVAECLADVARACGKTELVRDTATGPQTLHDALAQLGRPTPSDVLQLLREFDLPLLPQSERLPLPELAVAEDTRTTYRADAG